MSINLPSTRRLANSKLSDRQANKIIKSGETARSTQKLVNPSGAGRKKGRPVQRSEMQAKPSRSAILARYATIADTIAELLRPHAEVVVHNQATGCIGYIANGFSKRGIGDTSLHDIDADLASEGPIIGPYEKANVDGRRLRSITTVIRDFDDHLIGFLCINLDLTPFEGIHKAIEALLVFEQGSEQPQSLFSIDWREKINRATRDYLVEQSKTLAALTRDERIDLVKRFDSMGMFEARGAADYIASQLEVSRAALYRYLGEGRGA
jgi:predicted transcriptional regulator YheO